MAHAAKDDLRVGGLRLWMRFTLAMSVALAIVMAAAGFFLYNTTSRVAQTVQEKTLLGSLQLTADAARFEIEIQRLQAEHAGLRKIAREIDDFERPDDQLISIRETVRARIAEIERQQKTMEPFWKQVGTQATPLEGGSVLRFPIEYEDGASRGVAYRLDEVEGKAYNLLVPEGLAVAERGLLGLIIGVTVLVILVGAGVSVFVSNQVSGPIEDMVTDIRQISTGDLRHHARARGGGELELLARAINRMTKSLADAQDAELELQIREREVEVAGEVRSALLPKTTPVLPGYDVGATHLSSHELWGDFHDFIDLSTEGQALGEGKLGLMVCDVSGKGVPGALVGATARSILRSALSQGNDVTQTLQSVNRELAQSIRKGMYVTVLYVLVDPVEAIATLACAGHKIPLIRYAAEDGKIRTVQPEGIALAFDKGPIFDRALTTVQVPLEPGDRLVMVNTGAVLVTNEDGKELGEKTLYGQIMKHAGENTEEFLRRMKKILENYAGEAALPRDVSIVTIARN